MRRVSGSFWPVSATAGLSQGLEKRIVEFADLDGLVVSELFQGLGVVHVEFRERQRVLRIRQRRYRVAVVGAQSFPQLLVDAERQYGARFMEAGVIIELRYLVQAEDHVVPRTDPFTRVDCARFQGSRDFPSGRLTTTAPSRRRTSPPRPGMR